MAKTTRYFDAGIRLKGQSSDAALLLEGDMINNSSSQRLKAYIEGAVRELVTSSQSQTLTNKTISAASNTITGLTNSNIDNAAAIDRSKLASGSAYRVVTNNASGVMSDAAAITASRALASDANGIPTHTATTATELGYVAGVTSAIQTQLDGKATSTLADGKIFIGNGSNVAIAQSVTGDISISNTGVTAIGSGVIVNADINASAAVDRSKLASGTADHVIINNASGVLSSEATLAKVRGGSGQDNSSITFPASGSLATLAGTQVFTNKDYDGGTASNSSRITVPSNTKTNLDALTRKEATIVYGTDTDKLYVDNGTALVQVGSGTGSLDIFYSNDFETDTSSIFSTGNNATFLGGGSLQATLANETSSPISGSRSIKLTQAAGSLNDYIAFPAFTTTSKQKGQEVAVRFPYNYNGSSGDIKFVAYDVTNSLVLTSSLDVLEVTSGVKFFQTSFFIPSGCNSLRFGFQVAVANSGKILYFDDIELSTNSALYDLDERSDFTSFTPTGSWSTNTTYTGKKRRVGDCLEMMITVSLSGAPNSTALTITLPDSLSLDTNKINTADLTKNNFGYAYLRDDSATAGRTGAVVTYNSATSITLVAEGAGQVDQATPFTFANLDQIVLRATVPISNWSSSTSNIVTPVKSPKQYSLTVTGTSWTTTRAQGMPYLDGSGNWRMVFNIRGSRTTGSGISYYSITISGVTFKNVTNYSQPVTVGASNLTSDRDIGYALANPNASTITAWFASNDPSSFSFSGDVELESQPTFADPVTAQYLAAVPTTQIAYLKDSKSSGTAGGTFTSGSYQTRTLNTIEGDQWFVTLSSNQFTLLAGKYSIEASAPAFKVITHKCKIKNITDNTDTIIGSSEDADNGDNCTNRSVAIGVIDISSTKTFELQHRCNTTRSSDGFGPALTFGVAEIYSIVKIIKLK